MALKDRIYKKLPVFVQNLAISLYGYSWKKKRFGGVFKKEVVNFLDRENYSKSQWQNYQEQELQRLILHSINTVPYYKKTFQDNGLTIEKASKIQLKELKNLPILEKNDLREFGETELLSSTLDSKGEFFSSSGSTGTPTRIYFSRKMHQKWSAVFETRIRWWAGVNINDPRGMIGGRRVVADGESTAPFYRYNFFEKQTYFSAYHIAKQNIRNYIKGIKDNHIVYMTGYAMSNFFLARLIEESGQTAPQLKAVITSSEKLTKEMRETFQRVYGCRTYDSYSGVEACGLISECPEGSLHLSPDVAIVEILDEKGEPVKPGETGEAVCTGLLNFDQPLIRYRIGDLLTLDENQSCKCGREMPVIKEIVGRIEDVVIGMDGREMVRFHGVFINIDSIIEGQIVQWELSEFEILLVLAKDLTESEKNIIFSRMKSQLGEVKVRLKIVEKIPRNQNGKFKAVISHVKRNS